MDTSKVMLALTGLILLVCLVLSITALSTLRHAVSENEALQNDMEELAAELDGCVDALGKLPDASPAATAEQTKEVITDATVTSSSFCMRTVGDRIGIYTKDGYLIKFLETDPRTLPQSERELLQKGIFVSSWGELLALLEDYGE